MNIAFSFFLSIYSRCGAPAFWAARHTTVCLDMYYQEFIIYIYIYIYIYTEESVLLSYTPVEGRIVKL